MTKACSPRNAARRIHRSVPENTMPETRTFESRKNLTEIALDEPP